MSSLQNIIKYLGLAAISYFLIKAFANNKLTNIQIVIIVLLILLFVFFIVGQNFNCPKNNEIFQAINQSKKMEHFEPHENNKILKNNKNNKNNKINYVDEDIQDFKDIMGIDKQKYQNIKNNEKKIKNKIRSSYKDGMLYTETNPLNTVPLGAQLYGYTYLPPENWFRAYEKPPVCITDKRCAICPMTDKSIAGLIEFDASTNIRNQLDVDNAEIIDDDN